MEKEIYLFRLTHIENIPHILKNGITHVDSENRNKDYISIGDSSLINTRTEIILGNGKKISEYTPFYFGTRMPMLYVIQNGHNGVKQVSKENIVYSVSSIQKIISVNLDYVFFDGHARNSFSQCYSSEDVGEINEILDWNAINSRYWKNENDTDLKRRKAAEFLVHGDISYSAIINFLVSGQNSMKKLIDFGVSENMIKTSGEWFF